MCNAPACCRLHGLPSVVRYLLPILTKPQWLAQRRFVASVNWTKSLFCIAYLAYLCFTLGFKRFSEALHLPVVKSSQFSFPHHAIVPDDSSSHADNEEVQLQGQLRGFINPWGPWAPGYLYIPVIQFKENNDSSGFKIRMQALNWGKVNHHFLWETCNVRPTWKSFNCNWIAAEYTYPPFWRLPEIHIDSIPVNPPVYPSVHASNPRDFLALRVSRACTHRPNPQNLQSQTSGALGHHGY